MDEREVAASAPSCVQAAALIAAMVVAVGCSSADDDPGQSFGPVMGNMAGDDAAGSMPNTPVSDVANTDGPSATAPGDPTSPATMNSGPSDSAGAGGAAGDGDGAGGMGAMPEPMAPVGDPDWEDPGAEPFQLVPEGDVETECKMDIAMLKASGITQSHAVIRYGKLCYLQGNLDARADIFSATKTVSGTVMGAARYETRDNARQLKPSDLMSDWTGGSGDLRVSHLASMVANSASLEWGRKTFAYDTLGTNLARTGPAMTASLEEGSASGATTLREVKDAFFAKLGIQGSWSMGSWGTGAQFSLSDMARIGIVMTHGGWYNNERLIDQDWIYWMTHPPWEDANTSYGMYTWLNHRGNATGIGGDFSTQGQGDPGGDPCAPAAVWASYPHAPSEATDCMPIDGNSCEQMYDTGVFSAQGLGGQFIVGHRGLDLVLVVKNFSNQGGPAGMWSRIRPALVALDPMFMGDEAAFCEAYGNGNYAPDLKVPLVQPAEN